MKDRDKLIKYAIASVFALTVSGAIAAKMPGSATEQKMEKCYGIVKAGLNDCATATQSCAGSATKDKQSDAFLFLPKGSCEKIAGASLTSTNENKSK